MNERVAVTLGGGRQQKRGTLFLGQTQSVVGSQGADLEGRYRKVEVINRAGRTGKMPHIMHVAGQEDVVGDIMANEAKVGIPGQVLDVGHVAGDQVVNGNDAVAFSEEPVAEVGAEKPRAAGHDARWLG